ncbi:FAD/NAD-binding domain-containing protein [Fomitiporia mediterranea MF3/22]|uniref:FAD/NAD-binding domain-containing protein n=1 Tax=Fomitiporia mediterranea (strain MF3/22) TaxID=694068 RepID=UPI0004408B87|nr:FAD/NAD-binding domain-containing protein [Fomitiporia mediterranea MF3/22]EJD05380.1 FAD/NAD-binding domain-containing protein [Fomitiporia mediterranea MF3/22]
MAAYTGPLRSRAMSFPTKPVLKDLFRRRASVSLDFLVVGGSIAGLACAYNLKQAGHNVRVLERSNGPGNVSGGIRVPPNMTKLLMHWGLGDRLIKTGVRCPYIEFLESDTGSFLSSLVFHEEVMRELQADMYGLTVSTKIAGDHLDTALIRRPDQQYSDLYSMIYDITVASGVNVEYNGEVVDVDVDKPSVTLASGRKLRADIIVGADGATSIVREKLVGRKENHRPGPLNGYTYTVPVSKMMEDPELRPLAENKGVWIVWMGNNTCVLTFLVRPDEYAIQLIHPTKNARHDWYKLTNMAAIVGKFDDYEPRVRRLLRLATQGVETRHIIQEPLEDWYSENGHVVVLGDAAHVLNPGTSHGSSLAVEDAAVLGSLFSRLRTRSSREILRLLAAYQEIREDRCIEVTRTEYETCAFSVLPRGDPRREERDLGFAASRDMKVLDWENLDDPFLQRIWEQFKGSFGYEAYDAADDWWVDWGIMQERMAASSMAVIESYESSQNGEGTDLYN